MLGRMPLAIVLYTICLLLIFLFKPSMMFDNNGNFKHFGYDETDRSASLLNVEIVLVMLAIFSYFVVLAMELIVD
jgi:Ca2+/Na+ antiporter